MTGLTAMSQSGPPGENAGYSGIMYWDNTGGTASVITGAYPSRDTLIADPPTGLTSVPATLTVDGRLPGSGFFAAGLWPGTGPATAAGSAVIAHGTNTANTARLLSTVGAVGLVAAGVQVGAAGGELVYDHGAASA